MTTIDVVVYSFKNKNLPSAIDTILKNTVNNVTVHVYDQHPLLRKHLFTDSRISYHHVFWDYLYSPLSYKAKVFENSSAEYFLFISDDILLSPNWDEACLEFLSSVDQNSVISGFGKNSIIQKDLFSLSSLYSSCEDFTKSNFVSKNFLFGKLSVLNKISYPGDLKYFGEDELVSFRLFHHGVSIFSAPSSLGNDLMERTLENKYCTFSLEHKYNKIFEEISKEFWNAAGFDECPIIPLPYNADDVFYNPNQIDFNDLDSRKFISNVKAIY